MCGKKQSMPPVIMTSPKDDGQAHQISVTRPVFEYLGKLLRITISFPLSTRHNAMYGFDDMYRVLTMMCTNKASGSSEAGALSDLQDSGKTPSSRWVLGKIRAIDAREIRERCDHAIKREALDMKKAGMFRNPVVVAIDEHLVGWYGKGSDSQYITHSKSKNGTSRFYSLATVHCVAGGSRAALGAGHLVSWIWHMFEKPRPIVCPQVPLEPRHDFARRDAVLCLEGSPT